MPDVVPYEMVVPTLVLAVVDGRGSVKFKVMDIEGGREGGRKPFESHPTSQIEIFEL